MAREAGDGPAQNRFEAANSVYLVESGPNAGMQYNAATGTYSALVNPSSVSSYSPVTSTPQTTTTQTYPTIDTTAINQQLANQKAQQAIAALDKSKNAAMSNINERQATIKPKYDTAGLQARAQSGNQARSFSEYLAQRGLQSSGVAAQGEINRQGALQGTLGQLGTAEANAFADIERDRTSVLNNYESDVASTRANAEATALQNQIAEMQRQQDIARQDKQYNDSLALQQQQVQTQASNTAYNRQQDAMNQYEGTVGAFANNYQSEINRVQSDGDPSNDWQIAILNDARNQKVLAAQRQYNETGIVTADIADALGLPIGTTSDAYKAKLAQEQQKTQAAQLKIDYDRAWDKWTKNAPLTAYEYKILGITPGTKYVPPKNTTPVSSTKKPPKDPFAGLFGGPQEQ